MRLTRQLLIALACLSSSGCAAVVAASAAGVGIVRYQRNESTRDYVHDLEGTWEASLEAMRQLGYGEPLKQELLPLEAQADFEDAADQVRLRLEDLPAGGTRLIVRVGQFDNKAHRRKALVILEEVSGILDCDAELREWTLKVQQLGEPDPSESPADPGGSGD